MIPFSMYTFTPCPLAAPYTQDVCETLYSVPLSMCVFMPDHTVITIAVKCSLKPGRVMPLICPSFFSIAFAIQGFNTNKSTVNIQYSQKMLKVFQHQEQNKEKGVYSLPALFNTELVLYLEELDKTKK